MSPNRAAPWQLEVELEAARARGLVAACLAAEREAKLPQGLLLAIASRESGCRDVVGDRGHGRGVFQIDDRYHREWLASHGADAPGALPPVAEAAGYAARLVAGAIDFARAHDVAAPDVLKFALSAYNAGTTGALAGYRLGDSDLRTTGGDYGADVIERLGVVRRWLARRADEAERPVLREGARGPAVTEVKRRLRGWYAERLRGSTYDAATVEAVKTFQRAHGLVEDGVVGPQTWSALSRLRVSRSR